MQVFLQPVDIEHYEDTIINGRTLDQIQNLSHNDRNNLNKLFGNEKIYIWGVQSLKAKNFWDEIEVNNALSIFYRKKRFIGLGNIVYKLENAFLGNELWQSNDWKYIYFMKDFENINLSINDFNSIIGSNYQAVLGFSKISEERAEILLDNLSLLTQRITQADTNIPDGITKKMVRNAVNDYNNKNVPHTFTDSRDYDVVIDGTRYPPKAIIGLASRYILNRVLLPSEFSAGHDKKCFKTLLTLGFQIFPKQILPSIEDVIKQENKESKKAKQLSTADLKKKLDDKKSQKINNAVKSKESITNTYERDQNIVVYANRRANGICDLCNKPAPFNNKEGEPFLEVHHINQLAKGGTDWIDNVVALCPNCHRKVHILNDSNDIKKLKEKASIEL